MRIGNEIFKTMRKLHPAVKAIIKKDDKFLVIKQIVLGNSWWDFPGGKIEYGEDPYDTLVREVKEETDLSIEMVRPLGLCWFFRKDNGDQIVCATFLCEAKNYEIDLKKNTMASEDITEYRWVTREEFLKDEYVVGHESMKEIFKLL